MSGKRNLFLGCIRTITYTCFKIAERFWSFQSRLCDAVSLPHFPFHIFSQFTLYCFEIWNVPEVKYLSTRISDRSFNMVSALAIIKSCLFLSFKNIFVENFCSYIITSNLVSHLCFFLKKINEILFFLGFFVIISLCKTFTLWSETWYYLT